jgi:putative ubiquitin-RnfH superfamily antitoxin RatB of RatAB toxin-antitoxin module
MAEAAHLRITVAWSPAPRRVVEVAVQLDDGATVRNALQAAASQAGVPMPDAHALTLAVWGRKAVLEQPLHDLDRVEIVRGLKVDPKVARRVRFRKQGARAAGLFARKRDGAKQGY